MGVEQSGHEFAAASPELRSALGHTRAGEPLSNNRAPADDLAPWVARVYATQVEMDPGGTMHCGLISDTPVMRVLFSGDWTARTRDGSVANMGHGRAASPSWGIRQHWRNAY